MKIKILIIGFLVTLSFQLNSQNRYYYDEFNEFTLELPGQIYYDAIEKEGILVYETLYNDDLDADLTVYEGNAYEYLPTFTQELNLMANDMEYTEIRKFTKGSMSNEIKYEFYSGYSQADKCTVIFGLIQDSFTRKLYEFELLCYNLSLAAATQIINSIQIN